MLTRTPRGKLCYYPHLAVEETDALLRQEYFVRGVDVSGLGPLRVSGFLWDNYFQVSLLVCCFDIYSEQIPTEHLLYAGVLLETRQSCSYNAFYKALGFLGGVFL